MIEAYPLCWPDGWPRHNDHQRSRSRYEVTFLRARDELVRQLKLMRARDVVISTSVPLRRDGLPLANMAEPKDPGVAAYWTDRKGRLRVMACDSWRTVRENLRAVGLSVEAFRAIERAGASAILEAATAGLAALPAAADCWTILGIPRGSTRERINERYRELARQNHPDHGGRADAMARINAAYHEAIR
jgi:hypothetical protein